MKKICEKIGFNDDNIQFIGYSGYTGQNILNRYEDEDKLKINKMEWYKGGTLLESLNKIKPPKRPFDKPLIISISGVYKITGVGNVLCGKILSGYLKTGMELSLNCYESNEKSNTHSIQIDSSFISKSVNESENNYKSYKHEEKIQNRNKKENNDNSINENGESNQNFKMFSFDIIKSIEKNWINLQKINIKEETIEYIENIRNEKFKKEKNDNINEIKEETKHEGKIINDFIKNEIQLNDEKNKENNNIISSDKNLKNIRNIEKEEYEISKNEPKLLGEKKTDDLSNIKNNNKNENQSEEDIFPKDKGKYKENYINIKIITNKKTKSNENKRYYGINNDENENPLNINIKEENNRENVGKNIYLRNRKNKNKEDIKKTLSIDKNNNYENKDNLEKDNNIEFINGLQKISKYNNKKTVQKENKSDLFELENLGNKDLFKTRNRKKNIYSNDKKSHTLSTKHNKLKNKIIIIFKFQIYFHQQVSIVRKNYLL